MPQKGKVSDAGEPILMRFTQDIVYKEYGKFDSNQSSILLQAN